MASDDCLPDTGGGSDATLFDLLLPSVRLSVGIEGADHLLVYLVSIMLLFSGYHAPAQSGICGQADRPQASADTFCFYRRYRTGSGRTGW